MNKSSKTISLLILTLLASNILTIEFADAQSIPKPSVPEFTVKFVDRSFIEPQINTTTIDPFTGKQVTTTSGGYPVENPTIDVTIKNQDYPKIDLGNGNISELYLIVQTKGHFANFGTTSYADGYSYTRTLPSNSSYTVVTLTISPYATAVPTYKNVFIPDNGTEDFQVHALVGYYYEVPSDHFLLPPYVKFQTIEESGWSDIHTINLTDGSVSITPFTNPPPTPTPTYSVNSPTATPVLTSTAATSPGGLQFDKQQLIDLALIATVVVLAMAVIYLLVFVRKIKSEINQLPKQ
jgi:hypothetical protein